MQNAKRKPVMDTNNVNRHGLVENKQQHEHSYYLHKLIRWQHSFLKKKKIVLVRPTEHKQLEHYEPVKSQTVVIFRVFSLCCLGFQYSENTLL